MAAMSTAMAVAGSAVAAPATTLSSSAAFGASSGVQQFGAVRAPVSVNGSRMVAVRASQSSHEEQSGVKSKVLVALVAAGAALALNVAPVEPAYAGLFGGGNVKVERGATAPDFPGNEGTGTKVGENSSVRGSSNTGTPLGEGAGGSLVGDNQSTRQASSTGTPLGEGNINSGSGVNLGDALSVPSVPSLPSIPSIPNPLEKVSGLPDASNAVGDAKNAAASLAGDAKSKLPGGLPDASSVASDAKSAAKGLAGDAKSKLGGSSNVFGSAKEMASDVASSNGATDAKNAAGEAVKNVESAKSSMGLPNPMDAGKALMSKVTGN